jgi:hypothetical protein
MKHPIRAAIIAATAAFGLSGCATDNFGYGGLSAGYGNGYYSGNPYSGWYDDFYYPGSGYYVYDRGGRRHSWNNNQRRYWEGRRGNLTNRERRENLRGFRAERRQDNAQLRQERRENRGELRSGQITRDQFRAERRELRRERRQDLRGDRRALRRENRRDRRD